MIPAVSPLAVASLLALRGLDQVEALPAILGARLELAAAYGGRRLRRELAAAWWVWVVMKPR